LLHRSDETEHQQRNGRAAYREQRTGPMSPETFEHVGDEF